MISQYFNQNELKGFLKVSDVLIPGNSNMPKFSDTDFINYLDDVVAEASEQDREGLVLLFGIFSWLPRIFIRLILQLSEWDKFGPSFWQVNMRLINIGLKGIIYSLYYSRLPDENKYGEKIFQEIGWDTQIPGLDKSYDFKNYENDFLGENKAMLSSEIIDEIYMNAKIAEKEVNDISVRDRINYIATLKEYILANQEYFLNEVQRATGKTKTDILSSEIFATIDFLKYLEVNAAKILKNKKVHTPIALMGKKSQINLEPLGTILIISPWNYPFFQAIVPIANSLICGNATIYKPSEYTPLKGVVEKALKAINLPKNWVQVVYGDGELGAKLIDKRPDKIFFTGSVRTGKAIMAKASEQLIPVELELGGKDPMIVFDDVNLHRATSGALWGALTASGQSCTSVEKILVHENIYDEFKNTLVQKALKIKCGEGNSTTLEIGPMTTEAQVTVVREHLEDALEKGATLLTGKEWDKKSRLIPPLVIEGVTQEMKIYQEETFGPVLPLMSFSTEQEAIYYANDSQYGLTSSVWSKDLKRAHRVAAKLKVGGVSINNVMLTEGNPHLPFGGVKNSGMGRYKGEAGLVSFSNVKSVIANADNGHVEAHWYPFTEKKYDLFKKMVVGLFGGGPINFLKFLINGLKLEGHANKISR